MTDDTTETPTDEQIDEAPAGARIYGNARASEGERHGVYGETDAPDGYGLYTPDDTRVEGGVETRRVSGDRYAREFPGATLSERVENALADLPDGRGAIVVTPRADGTPHEWGSTLSVDPTAYGGIELIVRQGTEVEYAGDSWVFELDSNGDINSQIDGDRVRIRGGVWRSTDGADPAGWCRLVDVGSADVEPTLVRGFRNADGTSAMYEIAIDTKWSEDNRLSGRGVSVDVGVRFEKNGTNHSFVDTHVDNLHLNAATGMVLEGNHNGTVVDNFRWFPDGDGATGIVLDDSILNDVTFVNPRLDDAGTENDGIVGIRTTENYWNPSPLFIRPHFNRIGTEVSRADGNHGVWLLTVEPNFAGFENHGEAAFGYERDGSFVIEDRAAGETLWKIDGNGNVRAGGQWRTGEPMYPKDGLRQPVADLCARSETVPETVMMHDGSGSYPKDLYWWDDAAEWVRVGDSNTSINPS